VDTAKTAELIASPDLLCLRCHDQNADDGSLHHSGVMGREVEVGHLPEGLPLYQGRISCATCHNPHLRDASGARLRESLLSTDFCVGCHTY
jgi:predicted CXXCH cytochrome family protein